MRRDHEQRKLGSSQPDERERRGSPRIHDNMGKPTRVPP
jgi:hypothetical protein